MEREEFVRKVKEAFEEFSIKVRDYFKRSDLQRKLDKEERKLQTKIMLKEGLIEHWNQQIGYYESSIVDNRSLITRAEKEIKGLESDIRKVIKVINLFIID